MTTSGGTESVSKPKWYRRHWVQVTAAALIGLGIGGAGGGNSAADADKRATAAESRIQAAEDRATAAEKQAQEADANAQATIQSQKEAMAKAQAALDAREKKVSGMEAAAKAGTFDGDGTYRVGADIQPGTYKAAAAAGCYYARLRNLGGGFDAIIANNNTDGPVIVTIRPSDAGFTATRCAEFHKVG